jgi:hypothetical protein
LAEEESVLVASRFFVAGSTGGEEGAGLRVLENGDEEEKKSWFGFKGRDAAGLCEQGEERSRG